MNIPSLVVALVALLPFHQPQLDVRASTVTQTHQTLNCPCPQPTYQRISHSELLVQPAEVLPTHYVELDTDAGIALTLTLPATPTHMTRYEVWLGSQPGLPGGVATIDPNGQPMTFTPSIADTTLDVANEGRVLVYIKPVPLGGGYWRVSEL